jgi:predicted dehydrogenase
MDTVTVGIIGAGGVARSIHLPGLRLCPDVHVAAACSPVAGEAERLGLPSSYLSHKELLARRDIEAVVIATPTYLHSPIVLDAVRAGKHVLCEKPLALDFQAAEQMYLAAEQAGIVHMTAFTYRFAPAVQYLKHLINTSALGRLLTVRASYLMALSSHLLGWRSTAAQAGSGVLADIGSHLVHLVQLLAGEIEQVCASQALFRNDPASDVEDWIAFLADLQGGVRATFEISRVCPGRGAGVSENMTIEVYGTEGGAEFSLQDPWALRVAVGEDGRDPARPMQRVEVPTEFLRVPGSTRDPHAGDPRWGYRYDQEFQFVESVRLGQSRSPTLLDGVRCQAVLDAAIESGRERRWTSVRTGARFA